MLSVILNKTICVIYVGEIDEKQKKSIAELKKEKEEQMKKKEEDDSDGNIITSQFHLIEYRIWL